MDSFYVVGLVGAKACGFLALCDPVQDVSPGNSPEPNLNAERAHYTDDGNFCALPGHLQYFHKACGIDYANGTQQHLPA